MHIFTGMCTTLLQLQAPSLHPGWLVVTQGLCHDTSEPKSVGEAASSHTPAFPVLLPLSWVPLSLCWDRMDRCSLRLVVGFCGLFVVFKQAAQEKDWQTQSASNKHHWEESTSGVEGTVLCFSLLLFLGLRVPSCCWFNPPTILSSNIICL